MAEEIRRSCPMSPRATFACVAVIITFFIQAVPGGSGGSWALAAVPAGTSAAPAAKTNAPAEVKPSPPAAPEKVSGTFEEHMNAATELFNRGKYEAAIGEF